MWSFWSVQVPAISPETQRWLTPELSFTSGNGFGQLGSTAKVGLAANAGNGCAAPNAKTTANSAQTVNLRGVALIGFSLPRPWGSMVVAATGKPSLFNCASALLSPAGKRYATKRCSLTGGK